MARESLEQCPFTTVPTDVPGVDGAVLYVPERSIREDTVKTLGTTLADFMVPEGVFKGDALDRGYGSYVLSKAGDLADGWRAFWFAKVRTEEEIGTAYRTVPGIDQGQYWPPVLNTAVVAYLMAYDGNGESYVDRIVWDFAWTKKAYSGPVDVVEEFFASHVPFEGLTAEGMQDMGGTFDYGLGSMTLPQCLHGALDFTVEIGESSRYPLQTFTKHFDATVPTTWPDELITYDRQVFDAGLYLRKRIKALKPY